MFMAGPHFVSFKFSFVRTKGGNQPLWVGSKSYKVIFVHFKAEIWLSLASHVLKLLNKDSQNVLPQDSAIHYHFHLRCMNNSALFPSFAPRIVFIHQLGNVQEIPWQLATANCSFVCTMQLSSKTAFLCLSFSYISHLQATGMSVFPSSYVLSIAFR